MTRTAFLLLFLVFAAAQHSGFAATVEITLASKIPVTAEYKPGAPHKPALLLVHGFLQTREFPTIQRLAHSLSEEGYPILAPTLSLGVPKRKQSLACEAIHSHSYATDITELAIWVDWLAQRGHTSIVLIGHSFGSLQSLSYVARAPNSAVRALISLSLVDAGDISNTPHQRALREAKARIRAGNTALFAPPFAFCKSFPTTPENYLSYAQWDRRKILHLLNQVKIRSHIIIGSKDNRMGQDWPAKLRAQGASVTVIDGANHFFDDQYEFDLLETVLAVLRVI